MTSAKKFQNPKCEILKTDFERKTAISKQYVMFIKTWKVKEKKHLRHSPARSLTRTHVYPVSHARAPCLWKVSASV